MIVVDRMEGAFAVLEMNGCHVEVPVDALPEGVREGSHLVFHLVDPPDPWIEDAEARLARLRSRDPGDPIIDL